MTRKPSSCWLQGQFYFFVWPLPQWTYNSHLVFAHAVEKHDAPTYLHVLEFGDWVCLALEILPPTVQRLKNGVRSPKGVVAHQTGEPSAP